MKEMIVNHCKTISLNNEKQSMKKRMNTNETTSIITKKFKHTIDINIHWKNLYSIHKTTVPKIFQCQSKYEYLIIIDPLGDRSNFIISKSSYYWLNESIRLMQQHIEYGNTRQAVIIGEIIEIERNLKALKFNVEKHGTEKTYFYRAEALINFLRLCSTILEKPLEQYHQRLYALFKLCAISWLYMLDLMLPISIERIEKNFIFDDDYDDFENNSIIQSFRKDDQEKIRSIEKYDEIVKEFPFFFENILIELNNQIPNLRHLIYSIILIIEKCLENNLIDRIYLERFQMIYEIWILIDNEINQQNKRSIPINKIKQTINTTLQKLTYNFLIECQNYEQIFGTFTNLNI